ncbi:hypothetical protein B0O80DRAFT_429231 [Mortierella sp. GBAus27b]|nr:hypothetical protein BGX31_010387 [Mortierella sp. GBA43]KAI8349135.1 hypothetical protein B0O80DRAFT_429231 [Mortierella sp. GBAus27b]
MGTFSRQRAGPRSSNAKKPLLSVRVVLAIVLLNHLTPIAQANPFATLIGMAFNVFADLPSLMPISPKDADPENVVVFVRAGYSAPDANVGTQGITPVVSGFDVKERLVFERGFGNECNRANEFIHEGETKKFKAPVMVGSEITQVQMVAHDKCGGGEPDPICVASAVVLPTGVSNHGDPIYFSGTLLAECGASWYYGMDTFNAYDQECKKQRIQEKCVWMSEVPTTGHSVLKEVLISNVTEFLTNNEGTFRPSCGTNVHLTILKEAQSQLKTRSLPTNSTSKFNYAMYNHDASAIDLCVSDTSYGPSFLSLKENLYCDMATKTLIPVCNTQHAYIKRGVRMNNETCINSDGSFAASPALRGNSKARAPAPIPMRYLGTPPGGAGQNTTTKPLNPALRKRNDPSCVPKTRSKLVKGEVLWSGEQMWSADKTKRYMVQTDGLAVIMDANNTQLFKFGTQVSEPRSTYSSKIMDNGRFCNVRWDGINQGCIDTWATSVELYNNGLLYFKNFNDQVVVGTNLCVVYNNPLEVDKPILGGTCLMSPNHDAFLHMDREGRVVIRKGYDIRGIAGGQPLPGSILMLDDGGGLRTYKDTPGGRILVNIIVKSDLPIDRYTMVIGDEGQMLFRDSAGVVKKTFTIEGGTI